MAQSDTTIDYMTIYDSYSWFTARNFIVVERSLIYTDLNSLTKYYDIFGDESQIPKVIDQ